MTCSVCPGFGKPACLWPFSCPSTVGLPTEQERALAAIARVRQVLDEEQRGYNPPLGLISRIKTALEGDGDEPAGP